MDILPSRNSYGYNSYWICYDPNIRNNFDVDNDSMPIKCSFIPNNN